MVSTNRSRATKEKEVGRAIGEKEASRAIGEHEKKKEFERKAYQEQKTSGPYTHLYLKGETTRD
jgi:regulator of protease activity HflC (stomatin/prohibitin superfamily)